MPSASLKTFPSLHCRHTLFWCYLLLMIMIIVTCIIFVVSDPEQKCFILSFDPHPLLKLCKVRDDLPWRFSMLRGMHVGIFLLTKSERNTVQLITSKSLETMGPNN